jgi:hypothetical protein
LDEDEIDIGYLKIVWRQGLEGLPGLPPHNFNVSNVILGFIQVQLYSLMMDARHPKHVGGLTTV